MFINGVAKEHIVGFEDFGGNDGFDTVLMTRKYYIILIFKLIFFHRFVKAGLCKAKT